MKLNEIKQPEQLDEVSRRKAFAIGGGVMGGAYMTLLGMAIPALIPALVIASPFIITKFGVLSTFFAKGKQRTLADGVFKMLKNRDEVLAKLKDAPEDKNLLKKFDKLSENMYRDTKKLLSLVERGAGGAGLFRGNLKRSDELALEKLLKNIVDEPKTKKVVTLKDIKKD